MSGDGSGSHQACRRLAVSAEDAVTHPPRTRIAPTALSEQADAALVVARRSRS